MQTEWKEMNKHRIGQMKWIKLQKSSKKKIPNKWMKLSFCDARTICNCICTELTFLHFWDDACFSMDAVCLENNTIHLKNFHHRKQHSWKWTRKLFDFKYFSKMSRCYSNQTVFIIKNAIINLCFGSFCANCFFFSLSAHL